jgi:hypothetical protein
MEIVDKHPNRWRRHLYCTGGVHTDFGCGSMMAVEVSDLFYVYKYEERHPKLLVAFQCSVCGLGTVVAQEGSKEWTKWFDNLHRRNPLQDDDSESLRILSLALAKLIGSLKITAGRAAGRKRKTGKD